LYGLENGYLVYMNKNQNERLRLLVDWDINTIIEGLRD
jgi:hypothetical protein